jgi:hypothetical protein
VRKWTGTSAGVAPNKFLAKIASDQDKPDGFVVVKSDQVQQFLDPLPVGRIWGVGRPDFPQVVFSASPQRLGSGGSVCENFVENMKMLK